MFKLFKPGKSRFNPLVTVAVVAAWLLLMGALVKDRFLPDTDALTDALQLSQAESDDWFIIRIRGAYAGFGRSRQFKKGEGWALRDDLKISLNIQGQLKPIRVINRARVDKRFKLESFDLQVASGIVSFEQKGRMDGRSLLLDLPRSQGGGVKRMRLSEIPRISRSLGLPVPLTGLKVGDEVKIPIFDPIDGSKWDAVIKVQDHANLNVGDRDVEAWHIKAFYRTMDLAMWIDKEGRLLKGRLPLGITVARSTKAEISKALAGVRDVPEIMELAAVPVEGSLPHPRKLTKLRMEVVEGANLPMASDRFRQRRKGTEVSVKQETAAKATYSLPCKDPNMESFLASSRFIRSDDEKVIAKAKQIVGNEKDPIKAAQLINKWVYNYLKKVPTPAVPDALTVLQTKQGDCNEHAVLAVSLARAVGIPAKIALGLVYLDDGFYYHAWAVYWTGDSWVTGDPLLGQFPADASHVTLIYGDVDKHVNVLSFLGKLKFKILEFG